MTEKSDKSVIFVLGGITSGGAERVASRLMHYWTDKGWDITLIVGNEPEDDFYQLPEKMKRIVINTGSPSGNKIVGLMKNVPYIWRLRKALKTMDSSNVLSFLTRTNIHTILACMGLKKRVVISERNDTTREDHPWPWPMLRKWLYRYADVVTANSEIAVEGMKNYVPNHNLEVIPNPVYIPSEKATPSQSNKILNVGRLVPQKAQHLIIKAMSLIETEVSKKWSLHILGEGEERDELIKLTETVKVPDQTYLHGLVDDPAFYYKSAGIFVLSSKYEGTPNALLEAMSYGLPCIVSDSLPGVLSLIDDGKNGLIFSSGDATDLADKLTILMKDSQKRNQLGNQAREDVQIFRPENVMPIWDKLFIK